MAGVMQILLHMLNGALAANPTGLSD